ncbi:hypothetical protein [Cellulomonas xiejunii]|uniref:hypothetical protein n=1 Tax=Cellulomonas xiejunii TaxID=2968083 RepID=UPI001D0DEA0D|nr:hypothetical protein [Cellulomonas xiejunii]MCC2315179.1 hypothetical protein [Cellulomonas xiejunii]
MTSSPRELLRSVVPAAVRDDPGAWHAAGALLHGLDGRGWLRVDRSARSWDPAGSTHRVEGTQGWLGPTLLEPSGLVAAVTSLHVDGRVRQRATHALGASAGPLAAAALAVRTFDHVASVRDAAWASLDAVLVDTATIEAALDVLLAGCDRTTSPDPVDRVRDRALRVAGATTLRASGRRAVRRWALVDAPEREPLTPGELVAVALHDPDQWSRAWCAQRLADAGDVASLTALLTARSVEVRVTALDALPADALAVETLAALLLDRAPRVRELARPRARRRGIDPTEVYRTVRDGAGGPAWRRAVSLLELAEAGAERDLAPAVAALGDPSARVRAAAARATLGLAPGSEVADLLTPLLLDPSPAVSTAVGALLARRGLPLRHAAPPWASDDPAHRRTAWRLTRAHGGWHRVEADVRAATDPDPHLAELGRTGVASWLQHSAATTWGAPGAEQQARLVALLPSAGLSSGQARAVCFHAGLPLDPPPAATTGRRRWLRAVR